MNHGGVWTDSKEAILQLRVPENLIPNYLVINIKINPFVTEKYNQQYFSIFLNEHFIKDVALSSISEFKIHLSAQDLIKSSKIRLTFKLKNPVSSHEINEKNPDVRKLGLGFIGIKLNKGTH